MKNVLIPELLQLKISDQKLSDISEQQVFSCAQLDSHKRYASQCFKYMYAMQRQYFFLTCYCFFAYCSKLMHGGLVTLLFVCDNFSIWTLQNASLLLPVLFIYSFLPSFLLALSFWTWNEHSMTKLFCCEHCNLDLIFTI